MARNQNSSNSQGVCKKICKKLSLCTSHPNPQPETIPTQSDHRPGASVSSHKNKNTTFFLPKKLSNRNEQRSSNKPCPDHIDGGEIVIVHGQGNDQKDAKAASRQEHVSPHGRVGNNVLKDAKPSSDQVSAAKMSDSSKDEGKFSDYIRKVKGKMGAVSNVGSGKSSKKGDSFNDKVSHYINRAKIKIRTTTIAGVDKDGSFK